MESLFCSTIELKIILHFKCKFCGRLSLLAQLSLSLAQLNPSWGVDHNIFVKKSQEEREKGRESKKGKPSKSISWYLLGINPNRGGGHWVNHKFHGYQKSVTKMVEIHSKKFRVFQNNTGLGKP